MPLTTGQSLGLQTRLPWSIVVQEMVKWSLREESLPVLRFPRLWRFTVHSPCGAVVGWTRHSSTTQASCPWLDLQRCVFCLPSSLLSVWHPHYTFWVRWLLDHASGPQVVRSITEQLQTLVNELHPTLPRSLAELQDLHLWQLP